jgi:ferredoxin
MKILLSYFSGTGNSFKVIRTCKELFESKGYEPAVYPVNADYAMPDDDFEFYGFCFPVYGLGLPRIARKFISGMKPLDENKKAFLIVTGGDKDNNGWSLQDGIDALKLKNIDVTYADLIHMPNNWAYEHMSTNEECEELLDKAGCKTKDIIEKFLGGETYHKPMNFYKFGKLKSRIIYSLFKNRGIKKMWKLIRADANCTGCGLCVKMCPVKAVTMTNGKPKWNALCEQCMRCINFCPANAISEIGMKKIKRQYHEPGFVPDRLIFKQRSME